MVQVMMRTIEVKYNQTDGCLMISDHEEIENVWTVNELCDVLESFIDKGTNMDTTEVKMTGRATRVLCDMLSR